MKKILRSAEVENLFFFQQRELSPSPPSCSEPERLAGKTWSLVGEFSLLCLAWVSLVWFSLVWPVWKTWSLIGEFLFIALLGLGLANPIVWFGSVGRRGV